MDYPEFCEGMGGQLYAENIEVIPPSTLKITRYDCINTFSTTK